jgi:hypothetical protein|tara:strand:- start:3306 stop:4013 length:708 start_codon:yes stop_codon:yes gene_type:complete
MQKKYLLRYLFDFIVIVLGITVSFWFNQLSIQTKNNQERIKVLNNIQEEVEEIKKYSEVRLKTWNEDINIYNQFLKEKFNYKSIKEITTSKSRVEFNLIYYRDFEPPMNRYNSMINSGDIKYVKSEKLKEILTRLHTFNLSNIKTTVEYEKSLKEQLINLLTLNHSDLFIAGVNKKITLENYSELLHYSINDDMQLKSNLLVQMKYFKTRVSLLMLYVFVLEELEAELLKIKSSL